MRAVVLTTFLVICGAALPSVARAEDDAAGAQAQFTEGQKAFAAGDFRLAANAFEEAYRKKPHHAPLWNAARSWQRAGESVRAANLYVRYLREAPGGTKDRDVATQSLEQLATKLGKIVLVSAGPTDLKVDDAAADKDGNFVSPGEHVVSGKSAEGPVRKSVKVGEGQVLSVTLETPLPPPPKDPNPPPPKGLRLPWTVVAAGGVVTLAAAGVTVWSGLDTNSNREAFDQKNSTPGAATQDDLEDGKGRQLRTNIFLGATIGLAVLTTVAAFFVDWRSSSKKTGGFRGLVF